jgi:hypothetical protein
MHEKFHHVATPYAFSDGLFADVDRIDTGILVTIFRAYKHRFSHWDRECLVSHSFEYNGLHATIRICSFWSNFCFMWDYALLYASANRYDWRYCSGIGKRTAILLVVMRISTSLFFKPSVVVLDLAFISGCYLHV